MKTWPRLAVESNIEVRDVGLVMLVVVQVHHLAGNGGLKILVSVSHQTSQSHEGFGVIH